MIGGDCMNKELRHFQENMVDLINSAQLPTEAKRLVVCEVLHKLEVQANKEIAYEIQEASKQVASEEAKEE
jgi:hypothetical protein